MNQFYRYPRSAFQLVPIKEIQTGDWLAWTVGAPKNENLFGAIHLEEVIHDEYGTTMTYLAVEGMNIDSSEHRTLSLSWNEGTPRIFVKDDSSNKNMVLVLKKEKEDA